ncbi:MAG: hypothetical protein A3J74_00275 [Elusimicrobia bacterium RIFCSPHIGHO2_02_FULL_57_9]|nr:MAG: hypothetical protein A3J74_00275 [Elusimicrobia bacterium RIFCSPHIGHO2_02_FULL_57_9]
MADNSKGRLLVVDDEQGIVIVVSRCFAGHGYEVCGAGSAEEAIALVKERPFDLILLDSVLPGMSGMQAIEHLRRYSKAAIVMMTGHFDEQLKSDAVLVGAADCLSKPFDMAQLVELVDKLLKPS